MLSIQIERLKRCGNINRIIVATTTNDDDDAIVELCSDANVLVFRGSEDDVVDRVYKCCQHYSLENIVEITGDNPLSDANVVDNCIKEFHGSNNDFMSTDLGWYNNTYPKEFPIGLSVKIFNISILQFIATNAIHEMDREHVVNYILQEPSNFKIKGFYCPDDIRYPDVRLTVDHIEDFQLIEKIFAEFTHREATVTIEEILQFLDKNPTLKKLNTSSLQKDYRR